MSEQPIDRERLVQAVTEAYHADCLARWDYLSNEQRSGTTFHAVDAHESSAEVAVDAVLAVLNPAALVQQGRREAAQALLASEWPQAAQWADVALNGARAEGA